MEVLLHQLPGDTPSDLAEDPIIGHIDNVSQKGMCVSSPVPLMLSKVMRCEIGIDNLPVTIPTIAQVRWVERVSPRIFRSGLSYLL